MGKKFLNDFRILEVMIALALMMFLNAILGCSKEGVCIATTGEIISQARNVNSFDSLYVYDNVNVVLRSGLDISVIVEAGQNIINGITTDVVDNTLIISNSNSCNWLRSYDSPINVTITNDKLKKILYNSSGKIYSNGSLMNTEFKIDVQGGSGIINLEFSNLNKGEIYLRQGTADVILSGRANGVNVYAAGYGLYDARNMYSWYTEITTQGTNDCYVQAVHLVATIMSIGNIYYQMNVKQTLKETYEGTGQILPF